MFKIKKQIRGLYGASVLGNLSLTGAWVAILAARGYSLVEIGIAETVFHLTSLIFEIPSGVFADVFGRKKMLIVSTLLRMCSSIAMILSDNLFMVCVSIAFTALSYNFSSGTADALAYDSLKLAKKESGFEKYCSDQLIIYRVCGGLSTLCAGFALFIGHKIAYGTDLVTGVVQIVILASLYEVYPGQSTGKRSPAETVRALANCFAESLAFLKKARNAVRLMLCNALVGAVDILLLFFLQAKLPEKGIPGQALGIALLFMQLGGVVGAKLIVKFPKLSYKSVFVIAAVLVLTGVIAEHSARWQIMTLGGFLAAIGDDALQIRANAILQDMFPSEQRAALTSVDSFTFSIVMILLTLPAGALFTHW